MAEEPAAAAAGAAAAGWEWEDLSARHASISLPYTLELLKSSVADADDDAAVMDVIKEVRQRPPGPGTVRCVVCPEGSQRYE